MTEQTLPVLALVCAGTAVCIATTATIVPTLEYDPRTTSLPAETQHESPAQVVQQFLQRSGRLPSSGNGLVLRDGALAWETMPGHGVNIADVEVQRVRLTADKPLLASLLDDDPTCGADVEVLVTTADGANITLRVELWDYGLLTPWAFHPRGDGWKPRQVHWPRRSQSDFHRITRPAEAMFTQE